MKRLCQYHVGTGATVLDGVSTTADASNDRNSLESSKWSMPSTPTEYKSDSDDDWAAEQERMRALCKLERGHHSEWSMPSPPAEYKFDSEDDWTFLESLSRCTSSSEDSITDRRNVFEHLDGVFLIATQLWKIELSLLASKRFCE